MKKWYEIFKSTLCKEFKEFYDYLVYHTPRMCALLAFICIMILFVVVILHALKPHIEELYANQYTVSDINNLTKQEYNNINFLISKNRVVPISTIYSNTLSYYDSLISVLGLLITGLVALLGVFAFVSWISLRNKIKNEIDDSIEKLSQSALFTSWIKEHLDIIIHDALPDWLSDKEKILNDIKEQVICNIEKEKEIKINIDEEENINGD